MSSEFVLRLAMIRTETDLQQLIKFSSGNLQIIAMNKPIACHLAPAIPIWAEPSSGRCARQWRGRLHH